jgi:3-mercaptopyruvate sulfurtransferase SseA
VGGSEAACTDLRSLLGSFLTYLLGYPNVTNYDGSWREWGNLAGVPGEKGSVAAAG